MQAEQLPRPQPADAERAVVEPAAIAASRRRSAPAAAACTATAKPAAGRRRRRLAPRQYRPPISAGANCATAANAIRPYEASVAFAAADAVVAVGHRREAHDRDAAHPQHVEATCRRGAAPSRGAAAAASPGRCRPSSPAPRWPRSPCRSPPRSRRCKPPAPASRGPRPAAAPARWCRARRGRCQQRDAGAGDRHHHQRDHHEVGAEHPARAADVGDFHALDHGDVELPRQADDRGEGEQGLADEADRLGVDQQARVASTRCRSRAANQPIAKTPTAMKATSLTSDSSAIASTMPWWCSVASTWRVPKRIANSASSAATYSAGSPSAESRHRAPAEHAEADRDRLELQRDVRHRRDQRDHRRPAPPAVASGRSARR